MRNHTKIHLTLDQHEAKVLRQILKERAAFCAKEEKVIKRQAEREGRPAHMYTQQYYATRTIKAKALYDLVNAEITNCDRYVRAFDPELEQKEFPEPHLSIDELLNQHPEGVQFGANGEYQGPVKE